MSELYTVGQTTALTMLEEQGLLDEFNRLVLHPRGLSLRVQEGRIELDVASQRFVISDAHLAETKLRLERSPFRMYAEPQEG